MDNGNIREVKFDRSQEPNDAVIKVLEEWLDRAKSGEIVAVAIAGVKVGGITSTQWIGADGGWLHQLISAIAILNHRILMVNLEPE